MKRIIKNILVLACIVLPSVYACSQPPALAGAPRDPRGPGRTLPPPVGPDGPGGPRGLQQLTTVEGTVGAYAAGDNNEYNGFTLQSSGQTVNIRFAPYMAAQLMAAAKAGTSISIQGYYETTPEGLNTVHLVNATAGGQTVYDTPPAPPAVPAVEPIQTFSGTITDLRRDRQGNPNGILLSGKQLIDLAPHVYDQLQAWLKPGASVSGSGSRTTPPPGVVLAQNIQTIHPQTLTLNGQTYMVR